MKNRIIIIDYGMGNLRSVQKKFARIGAEAAISSDPEEIRHASKLILPGVGHFANGVKKLTELGIWDVLNKAVLIDQTPILGICLGMQLMAGYSEEGAVEGLGWFDADVIRFRIEDKIKYKVPHMAWNIANAAKESFLFENIPDNSMFYFAHSYHMKCNDQKDVLCTTEYEYEFTSAIQKANIYGAQFHPEKSHDWGEQLLANFVKL
jgi:glutamine amidotransferase